jgi:tungstate transport system ATP-binding protein
MNGPADESVVSFLGAGTVLSGPVVEKRRDTFIVAIGGKEIESVGDFSVGESVDLYIRPENVTLSIDLDSAGQERATRTGNLFPASIVRITPLGFYEKVLLDCGFPLVSYVTRQSREDLDLREGQPVMASFGATAIHVITRGRQLPDRP